MALIAAETDMPEGDLIVRARSDRSAFAVLYDRYYPAAMRYRLRRLFVRAVAEDVASEAFCRLLAAYRALLAARRPTFDGGSSASSPTASMPICGKRGGGESCWKRQREADGSRAKKNCRLRTPRLAGCLSGHPRTR